MRFWKPLVVVAVSSGWAVLLGMAAWLYMDFWQIEGGPQLFGHPRGNSFEWFGPIKSLITWGTAWLFLALAYWSWKLWHFISIGARPNNSSKPTPLRGAA